MHQLLDSALEDATPGLLVRLSSTVMAGAALTAEQIRSYSAYWRAEAKNALDSDDPFLVILGDSLGQGIGASRPGASYAQLLRARVEEAVGAPVGIVNLSRSGARIRDVVEKQLPALAILPDRRLATVCTVGSNDVMRSTMPARTRREVRSLVSQLPDATVLATIPAGASTMAKLVNRRIRHETASSPLHLADVAPELGWMRGLLAADRVHPNDQGYEIWAAAFDRTLREAGVLPPTADTGTGR
ncbi:MAG: SGNH/GDSL hydrolase family protein [Acidimicrobiales bacterium]